MPYHYRHFDELMADIGDRELRRNPLAERVLPPDAYAQFLASAPDYRAAASGESAGMQLKLRVD